MIIKDENIKVLRNQKTCLIQCNKKTVTIQGKPIQYQKIPKNKQQLEILQFDSKKIIYNIQTRAWRLING